MGRRGDLFPPFPDRLLDVFLAYQPDVCYPLADGSGPFRDAARSWHASVTGSPVFGAPAPAPIDRGVTFTTGQYGASSAAFPVQAASVSAVALMRTTNATAANRPLVGRHANFQLYLNGAHTPTFSALQATTASHCGQNSGLVANNGLWWLVGGSFDGTTVRCASFSEAGVGTTQTNTTLTGSWSKGANAVEVGALAGAALGQFQGTLAYVSVWNDRIVSLADMRSLASAAFGG